MMDDQPASSQSAGKRRGRPVSAFTVVLALVAIGVVLAIAYWQKEVSGFVSLRGWDREAPRERVVSFIRNVHSNQGQAAASALEPDRFTPMYTENRLTAVQWIAPRGPTTTDLKQVVPVGEVKTVDVEPRHAGGTSFFRVVVEFADGQWGEFRVSRPKGKLVITRLPEYLGKERPKLLFGD